ncbi:MAG: hypothetical protein ACLQAH_03150 [Limisphaerales bacterium]
MMRRATASKKSADFLPGHGLPGAKAGWRFNGRLRFVTAHHCWTILNVPTSLKQSADERRSIHIRELNFS